MKKIIIGSLVGAFILFIWGFLSWVVLPVHQDTFNHTPFQDSILGNLAASNFETGAYFLPIPDRNDRNFYDAGYREECEKHHEEMQGKPFATIIYSKEGMTETPGTLIAGFLFSFISVFCVSLLLGASGAHGGSFFSRWWLVMLVALILCFQGPLMGWNWMAMPWHHIKGMLFDHIIGWGLCGAWLAWYYGRE